MNAIIIDRNTGKSAFTPNRHAGCFTTIVDEISKHGYSRHTLDEVKQSLNCLQQIEAHSSVKADYRVEIIPQVGEDDFVYEFVRNDKGFYKLNRAWNGKKVSQYDKHGELVISEVA